MLDTARRELRHGTELIAVEPQVFDLLNHLIRHRDRVVTKDDLMTTVWSGRVVSESALTSRINAVRAAIGDSGEEQRLIKTLRGRGFRFIANVREQRTPPRRRRSEPRRRSRRSRPSISRLSPCCRL